VVLEFDPITGDVRTGGRKLSDQIKNMVTRDLIFDVTADTVGMLVPGGSIAVKLVKVVVDQQMTEPNQNWANNHPIKRRLCSQKFLRILTLFQAYLFSCYSLDWVCTWISPGENLCSQPRRWLPLGWAPCGGRKQFGK